MEGQEIKVENYPLNNPAPDRQNRIARTIEKLNANISIQYLLLAAITLFAAVLRIYKISEWGFWIDEIYTIDRATGDLGSLLVPLSTRLISIPLGAQGIGEFSARILPGLVGVLSIPIFFFPIRKITDGTIALLATLLLALSPWHLYWSQNARFYSTLMLFYGLAGLCLFIWLEGKSIWYMLISMGFIGFAMLERGTTLFIFPVFITYIIALYILPIEKPPGLSWKNLALFFIPIFLFGLLVVFSTGNLFSFFSKIFGHQHNPIRVLLSVIYDVGLPLFLLAILGGVYSIYQKNRLGLFLIIGTLVPLLILVIIAPFTQAFSRYVFQTLIFWIILGAMAIQALIDNASGYGKYLALGIALLLIADALSQDVLYFSHQNGNREDFKGAYQVIADGKKPNDLIVAGWPEIGRYYLDEPVQNAVEVKRSEIANSDHRVWFVVDNRSGFPSKLQEWIEKNSQLIGVRDVYIPGKLMMMRVYLYEPDSPY
jgi:mannosyltransferase